VPFGVSMIAFGGFSWALDGAAAPVAAVLRLEPAMRPAGGLRSGDRSADETPAREIRLRDVTFAYPAGAAVLEHFDLTIRRLVARHRWTERRRQDHDRQSSCAGCTIRNPVRSRSTEWIFASSISRRGARASRPCSGFIRLELPLARHVAPAGAPDDIGARGSESAGATKLATLDTISRPRIRGGTRLVGRPMAARRARPSFGEPSRWRRRGAA